MAPAAEVHDVTAKRTHRQEKLARIYDDEILPIWSHRFGRMMLRGLDVPPKAMLLDVACGTGYPALEVLRKLDDQSRLIAIDSSSMMLDVARKKAGDLSGKRVFFRTENAYPRLPFTDEVYDLVICNLGITEMPSPRAALKEFARVTKTGGKVLVTLPLAGTWGEFHDIYREVLVKHDKHDMLERLDRHIASFPEVEEVERWFAAAGMAEPHVDVEEFSLLFRSSREFFFAPVVEYGPLPKWKEIAGKGQELQDVFWYIKQAIDAYFGGRAFQITVKAGCIRGIKGERVMDDAETGRLDKLDSDDVDYVSINTGEVEMVEGDDVEDVEIEAFRDDRERDDEN